MGCPQDSRVPGLRASAPFSLLPVSCFGWSVCLCVFPPCCPIPVPLWRQVGNSQSGIEQLGTSSGLSGPLPSYSGLENDLKASCAVSLQGDCWVILGVAEAGDQ